MDNKEFKEEVHNYIDECLVEFESYQSITQEILCVFDKICRQNSLKYWLAYGTLIGAIRDKGMIPWDYDVDLIFPATSFRDLITALKNSLPKEYYYIYTDIVPDYPTDCLRVCKHGYDWRAFHVDIFFLIGCPDEEKKSKKLLKKVIKYHNIRMSKFGHKYFCEENQSLARLFSSWLGRFRYFYYTSKMLRVFENKLLNDYPLEKFNKCIVVGDNKIYSKDIFGYSEIELYGRQFYIPSEYERFFKIQYDDWRKYYPIKSRFEEFYKMNSLVKERQLEYKLKCGSDSAKN